MLVSVASLLPLLSITLFMSRYQQEERLVDWILVQLMLSARGVFYLVVSILGYQVVKKIITDFGGVRTHCVMRFITKRND